MNRVAFQRRAQHVHRHRSQLIEWSISMTSNPEVHLRQTAHSELTRDVDQQRDFDPVCLFQ